MSGLGTAHIVLNLATRFGDLAAASPDDIIRSEGRTDRPDERVTLPILRALRDEIDRP